MHLALLACCARAWPSTTKNAREIIQNRGIEGANLTHELAIRHRMPKTKTLATLPVKRSLAARTPHLETMNYASKSGTVEWESSTVRTSSVLIGRWPSSYFVKASFLARIWSKGSASKQCWLAVCSIPTLWRFMKWEFTRASIISRWILLRDALSQSWYKQSL